MSVGVFLVCLVPRFDVAVDRFAIDCSVTLGQTFGATSPLGLKPVENLANCARQC